MVDRGVFSDIFNPLSFVDKAVRTFAATKGPVDMGPDFAPGVGSVICGRGKECYNHEGNRRFRALCETHLERYKEVTSKVGKSQIVTSIVDSVREGSGGAGGFVARDPKTNRWVDVGDDAAREKTGQQLRDLLTRKRNPGNGVGSASSDRGHVPPLSPPRSVPASRKRTVNQDPEKCCVRRRGAHDDGTLDWMASSAGTCASPTLFSATPSLPRLSRRAASPTSASPLSDVDSAPPTGSDTPPELAPSVSLGRPNEDGLISNERNDPTRNQRFVMPACRGVGRTSLTPFWNSPLGVAADLFEFFDHGEDDDDDDDDDDEVREESGSQRCEVRPYDIEDDAGDRCDPRGPKDPLFGLDVPQF